MKNFKKVALSALVCGALFASFGASAYAKEVPNSVTNKKKQDNSILLEGEVGTNIRIGDLVFKRVETDTSKPSEVSTLASTSAFSITLSGSSKSEPFNLSGDYKYAKVWINNTSSGNLIFTITQNSPTGTVVSGSSVTVSANSTWNVYSTNAWPAGTYYANYTSGQVGLSGSSACRIASTQAELDL
jgi:hypothetical protein